MDAVVVSKILHARDMSAIAAGGAAVDITDEAETLADKVLYNNRAYQELSWSSAAGQWCTRLAAVRKAMYGSAITACSTKARFLSSRTCHELDGIKTTWRSCWPDSIWVIRPWK
ncbi:hypothetical protein DMH17_15635 [Raoultella planticola]|nr:hypothetical protein [Raoultella planticola]